MRVFRGGIDINGGALRLPRVGQGCLSRREPCLACVSSGAQGSSSIPQAIARSGLTAIRSCLGRVQVLETFMFEHNTAIYLLQF